MLKITTEGRKAALDLRLVDLDARDHPESKANLAVHEVFRIWQETKPSPKTTELWFMVAGIAALFAIYQLASDTSLNLFRACVLGTVLAAAYIVSRGVAKAGSHHDHEDTEYVSSHR